MVSVLPCKVTVTFFILLSNEIVCSKSLVRSDMKCILYVIAPLFLNSMFTLYHFPSVPAVFPTAYAYFCPSVLSFA